MKRQLIQYAFGTGGGWLVVGAQGGVQRRALGEGLCPLAADWLSRQFHGPMPRCCGFAHSRTVEEPVDRLPQHGHIRCCCTRTLRFTTVSSRLGKLTLMGLACSRPGGFSMDLRLQGRGYALCWGGGRIRVKQVRGRGAHGVQPERQTWWTTQPPPKAS